ncbi:MAG: tripartite tricarboxylate transporter TctB family protein [Spirochaetaceae bacterium]|nr:MAG: tripartite tricarboxylate transporter TctB family protein [Spirochaetaceae bacterium]
MLASEIVFGAIFMLLSIFFFAMTFRFPELTIALSPTVFPRFVTICLFVLSLLLLIQGLRKQMTGREEKSKMKLDRAYLFRFILIAVIGFLYTRIIRYTGYLVATPLFIAANMFTFEEKKWYRIVLVSIITTAILYGVFRMIFRVPLPRFNLW